jgi:hypothetical protein
MWSPLDIETLELLVVKDFFCERSDLWSGVAVETEEIAGTPGRPVAGGSYHVHITKAEIAFLQLPMRCEEGMVGEIFADREVDDLFDVVFG